MPLSLIQQLAGRFANRKLPPPRPTSPYAGSAIGRVQAGAPGFGDPMTEAARQVAAGIIDPQLAEINRMALQKQRDQQARQLAYQGVIDAVGKMTAGIPESIRAAYANAGQDTSSFASALTGQLGEDARAQAAKIAETIGGLAPGISNAVTSQTPAALNVANYSQGTLNANDLAHEAASRLAEAQSTRASQGALFAQQALQSMNATQQEIDDLRAKGLDLENTRPAEIQKALADQRAQSLAERQFGLQARAERVQEKNLNRAWLQTLQSEAFNRTNATGTLWVVKGNKVVNTGKPAPGSKAAVTATTERGRNARANQSAKLRQRQLREQEAHNKVTEGIANAQLGISQARANAYIKKEQRLQNGGYSQSQRAKWANTSGQSARAAYNGVPNPNYDPAYDPTNPDHNDPKGRAEWIVQPKEAPEVLRDLMASGVPYSIAYNAIRKYASKPDSRWVYALGWQKAAKPPKKKR